jgi:hypothetical protein
MPVRAPTMWRSPWVDWQVLGTAGRVVKKHPP